MNIFWVMGKQEESEDVGFFEMLLFGGQKSFGSFLFCAVARQRKLEKKSEWCFDIPSVTRQEPPASRTCLPVGRS